MKYVRRSPVLVCAAILATVIPSLSAAQTLPPIRARDSVTLRASDKYEKGGLHRFLFGDNYRDIWNTPVKVPVLDLADPALHQRHGAERDVRPVHREDAQARVVELAAQQVALGDRARDERRHDAQAALDVGPVAAH